MPTKTDIRTSVPEPEPQPLIGLIGPFVNATYFYPSLTVSAGLNTKRVPSEGYFDPTLYGGMVRLKLYHGAGISEHQDVIVTVCDEHQHRVIIDVLSAAGAIHTSAHSTDLPNTVFDHIFKPFVTQLEIGYMEIKFMSDGAGTCDVEVASTVGGFYG